MAIKDKITSLEQTVKAISTIVKSISENLHEKNFGYSVKQMHEYIEQCISYGRTMYVYTLYVHLDEVATGVGSLQLNNYKEKVVSAICKDLNKEKDTVAGFLEQPSSRQEYLIGAITPLDSKDFISSIVDDMVFDPEDISMGETIIYEDDTLQSVLLRCEYSSFVTKTDKDSNYTIMTKI